MSGYIFSFTGTPVLLCLNELKAKEGNSDDVDLLIRSVAEALCTADTSGFTYMHNCHFIYKIINT